MGPKAGLDVVEKRKYLAHIYQHKISYEPQIDVYPYSQKSPILHVTNWKMT
jgi:hypothetical protein